MTGNSMDWWKGGNSKPTSLSNHRGTFLMGRYARKKQHKGDKPLKEKYRTKRKTKDLDQIDEDLRPENSSKLQHQEVDLDKPGSGQFYCLHCAKYFIDTNALRTHFKSKPHKRRLKALETEPYTQAEAERAAGMGSYKEPSKRKMETQSLVSDMKVDISGDGVV